MTQAFNLAQFANNVNATGQAAAGTSLTGTVPVANGGTNLATIPTNGQLLIGNGTGYTQAALTAGSNITITNGIGSITVAATAAAPSTTDVLNATAGASVGAVGSYALLGIANSTTILTAGTTYAGSSLRYAGFVRQGSSAASAAWGSTSEASLLTRITQSAGTPAGTWRALGYGWGGMDAACPPNYWSPATLFLRIS